MINEEFKNELRKRADRFIDRHICHEKNCVQCNGLCHDGLAQMQMYSQICSEQREVDIQRAVEFLKNEVDIKDHSRYTKEWYIEQLIKTMKGEE